MQEIVGVQYKPATKVYYFDPKSNKYELGQNVIVETVGGLAFGTIAIANKMVKKTEIEEPLKPVVRLATENDYKQVEKIKQRAINNFDLIVSKIESLNLAMKVVEVEYSFDETKVTIFYTAEGRVDFRELLKILASALKVKIELRQIGTREEVKTVGALGLCGNPCCCTTFLKEPERVVVKMVKLQNLSMSPTKTGGACGRMMCCLAYENPMYKEILSKMPKVGSTVKTPDGEGVVQYNNILHELVTVKIFQNDESFKIKEFTLSELSGFESEKIDDDDDLVKQEEKQVKEFENLVALESKKDYNNDSSVEQKSNDKKFNKKSFFKKKNSFKKNNKGDNK